jgi:TolB-like protein
MRKLILLLYISIIVSGIAYSQNIFTLDSAISDYSTNLVKFVPKGESIAIIAFETDKDEFLNFFYASMIENIWKQGDIILYERSKIETLQKELDFSLTGKVSDETAQRIGQFVGVGTVIYGSLTKIGSDYLLSIRAASVESGRVLFPKSYDLQLDTRLAGLLGTTQTLTSSQSVSQINLQGLEAPKSFKSAKPAGLLSGGIGLLVLSGIGGLSSFSGKPKGPGPGKSGSVESAIPILSIIGGIIGLSLIIGYASD